MRDKLIGYCVKCGNQSFRFEKKVEGDNPDKIMMYEVLNHDGFGFDLNTFDIICEKCGRKDTDRFKLKKTNKEITR